MMLSGPAAGCAARSCPDRSVDRAGTRRKTPRPCPAALRRAFVDRGFEHVPSLAPVADLLTELLAA
jgi:hypothetical protein